MLTAHHTHLSLMKIGKAAALTHGLLDVSDPHCSFRERFQGRSKRIALEDGTPALIYVGPCWRDEWITSITLWPTPKAEEHVFISGANARAGEVFAWGWLNRWQYDGRAIGIERFHSARAYVAPARRAELAALLSSHAAAA
jgi:hypothetical protein